MDVYLSGVGMTKFGKSADPLQKIMADAAISAFVDAHVERVDAIYFGAMNAEGFKEDSNFGTFLTDTISVGVAGMPSSGMELVSFTEGDILQKAFDAIASGHLKSILIVGGDKMTHLSPAKMKRILCERIDRSERRYGATVPALGAMMAQKYAHDFHFLPPKLEDVLSQVARKNLANGALNPYAPFGKMMTKEEYLKSPLVSYPIRQCDWAPVADGAAAIILTSQPTSVKVSGIGQAAGSSTVRHRTSFTSFSSTKEAALRAYSTAQVGPSDIEFAEVYDAFTLFEIIGTEDLGFFPPGAGWKALGEGISHLEGKLPINPSGGLKSRGDPTGASGLAQLVEIAWQLRGEAGAERQLERAKIGLAQWMEGLGNNNLVTILERSDRKKIVRTGWTPDYHPEMEVQKRTPPHPLKEETGVLETFTVLYDPPEGFRSPLALGVVKTLAGDRVMACNPDYRSPRKLKIGQKAHVRPREGLYVFETPTFLSRLIDRIKRPSRSKRKEAVRKRKRRW